MAHHDLTRPYLVIPKLIEQPTWGGEYIASAKGWQDRTELRGRKIGQSYELFSGSNLSLADSSADRSFAGELTDRDAAQVASAVPNAVPLAELVKLSAEDTLGRQRGAHINLLIKFTQALGNSFQLHLKDGETDPYWKPKPESWYYFEPGLITLGAKDNWQAYEAAVTAVEAGMKDISQKIKSGELTYEQAKPHIDKLIHQHDPWQFVNLVGVAKDGIVDVSAGAIHHSWEEDAQRIPLGNVLYELQTEAMDDVSTLRSFDKGKIGQDGSLRDVHIKDYFRLIDRSPKANNPQTYMLQPEAVDVADGYELSRLLQTKYYKLHKLVLAKEGAVYHAGLDQFSHVFVKAGLVTVATPSHSVEVGTGHSCFVPAAAGQYTITAQATATEVLISQ